LELEIFCRWTWNLRELVTQNSVLFQVQLRLLHRVGEGGQGRFGISV
jgi:hypothetical protein